MSDDIEKQLTNPGRKGKRNARLLEEIIAIKITGTVNWFNVSRGYGFIKRHDNGEDVFVHQSSVIKNNPRKAVRSVGEGETVEFVLGVGEKGYEAANVTGPDGIAVIGSRYAREKPPPRRRRLRRQAKKLAAAQRQLDAENAQNAESNDQLEQTSEQQQYDNVSVSCGSDRAVHDGRGLRGSGKLSGLNSKIAFGVENTNEQHNEIDEERKGNDDSEYEKSKQNVDVSNENKITGTVNWFNVSRGYGFIKRHDNGEDVFVHQSSIIKNNPRKAVRSVGEGETVEFILDVGEKGYEAANVTGPDGVAVIGSRYAREKPPPRRRRPRRRAKKLAAAQRQLDAENVQNAENIESTDQLEQTSEQQQYDSASSSRGDDRAVYCGWGGRGGRGGGRISGLNGKIAFGVEYANEQHNEINNERKGNDDIEYEKSKQNVDVSNDNKNIGNVTVTDFAEQNENDSDDELTKSRRRCRKS